MIYEIVLATENQGKLKEFAVLMSGVSIRSLADYPEAPGIVEDGETFAENALKKARTIAAYTGRVTVADDSGLAVDALGGAPGIFSARYAGLPKSDARNNEKLLNELADVPWEQRTARFVCALAIVFPGGREYVVEGTCEGYILNSPRGHSGFGYDPLFFYPPLDKSMAELSIEEKNKISHRAKAFVKGAKIISGCMENIP